MLFSLIYYSKANHKMTNDELSKILVFSRDWNNTHGITGMLLYMDYMMADETGRFIQVLEGEECIVHSLFNKIKIDERHRQVTPLNEESLTFRNFSGWQMGFKSINSNEFNSNPSFFPLNEKFFSEYPEKRFNTALTFLKSFYKIGLKS